MKSTGNQVIDVAKGLSFQERNRFFRVLKAYEKSPSNMLAQKLEDYGMSIDVKDYGEEQNVERGQINY